MLGLRLRAVGSHFHPVIFYTMMSLSPYMEEGEYTCFPAGCRGRGPQLRLTNVGIHGKGGRALLERNQGLSGR